MFILISVSVSVSVSLIISVRVSVSIIVRICIYIYEWVGVCDKWVRWSVEKFIIALLKSLSRRYTY